MGVECERLHLLPMDVSPEEYLPVVRPKSGEFLGTAMMYAVFYDLGPK